jgi:hypothetical protein
VRRDSCRLVGRPWVERTTGRRLLPHAPELQKVVGGDKGILAGVRARCSAALPLSFASTRRSLCCNTVTIVARSCSSSSTMSEGRDIDW